MTVGHAKEGAYHAIADSEISSATDHQCESFGESIGERCSLKMNPFKTETATHAKA